MRLSRDQRPRRTFTAECRGVPVHITEEVQHRPEPGDSIGMLGGWLTHYEFRAVRSEHAGRGASGVPFPISETGYRSHFHHGEPFAIEQIIDRLDWIADESDKTRAGHLRYLEGQTKHARKPAPPAHDADGIRSRTITLDPTGCAFAARILTLPDDADGQAHRQRIIRASLALFDAIDALPVPTGPATICGGREVPVENIMGTRRRILAWREPLTAALDSTGEGGTGDLFGGGAPDLAPLLALAPRLGILPEPTEADQVEHAVEEEPA